MPNYVINVVKFEEGFDKELARKVFLDEEGFVSFEKIYPKPECLKEFSLYVHLVDMAKSKIDGKDISREYESLCPEEKIDVDRALSNYNECGYVYWYDWTTDVWGTKWNATCQPDGGQDLSKGLIVFQTAWEHPGKILSEFSKKLPDTSLFIEYADEDIGSNCDSYHLKNGERYQCISDNDAELFGLNLWKRCGYTFIS